MKFGEIPVAEAAGAILAHSQHVGDTRFKKGRTLTADDVAALAAAGIATVVAAQLEPGDIGEDQAADRLATAAAADGSLTASVASTGRVNLYAAEHGLVAFDPARLDELNLVDEAIAIATLPAYTAVEAKQMVATIKIIPFAVPGEVVDICTGIAAEAGGLIRVAPFRPHKVGLIQTRLSGTKESVLDKGREVTAARVGELDGELIAERRCAHDEATLAAVIGELEDEGCEVILVLGASAITDRRDVVPAAVERAGGTLIHLGMPVDPGNLTLLARSERAQIVGLPGSARSPRLHGCDWVLQRLAAGLPPTSQDIMTMGAGGLLKEIPARPLPRAAAAAAAEPRHAEPRIAALILAAGQSRRMGRINKLLEDIDGAPMVARAVDAVISSRTAPVFVVVGHEADRVRGALAGRDVVFVDNPAYAEGLSTSLKHGVAALPEDADGVLVCLGDMPRIAAAEIDALIDAFDPIVGRSICVPTFDGKRGNPVLLGHRFFAEIQEISGDVGARQLIGAYPDLIVEVAMDGDGVLVDIDTPQALKKARV
ncbi:MAG: molybdopterin-binding/glycosyltransferase family 2 protein [Alphaproteobacteria bacterium]|jgi:molybdenum cofactor cytidylyltransferase|nr:molybdopterin-binding/glycosyltransferase family 2 protein [Alphaproteobacteria bacterium]